MNLAILGPQGCGKGTQAIFLAQKHNLIHLEMGSALREEAKKDTPLGKKLNEIINVKKELVSDEIIKEILIERLASIPPEKGIILDGAPRRVSQIDETEAVFDKFGRKIDNVIFIGISPEESVKRISRRFNCLKCGERLILGENIQSSSDSCPKCGGKIEQRPDDTPEGVRKRLAIFQSETIPVVEYYRAKGSLIEVNGEQPKEKVLQEIEEKLEK